MKKTVLIVDDSTFAYEELKALLVEMDFDVIGYCRSGEEAIETCKNLCPDLVTMDYVLPGMDGIDTCQEILKQNPEIKVILVSSMAYDEMEQKGFEAGASSFVYKPIKKKWLVKALLEAFEE